MSSGLIDTITGVPPALENSPAVLPPDGTAGRESVFLSVNSNRDHASRDDSGQDVTGARYRARESLNNDRQKRSI